ncbi:MAG: outer membrane protein assembly factor BamD [Desulfobacula sp.]|nr:outer membrane protein assembly factor BamD [Desulfobacula sp.]MBT3483959.1 outer membrane protein assembly factor BamD [Desulfobacula sp.]MBT3803854.1 outer membrane protein assembly factor BamD [Desulfobacula sp.]MBT4023799.1 outer membrane protein assembly factor BamD [Desulfobacula sp.]MBT4197641.1 outer membrane protein assembly factor BamD [Desulfobacula sp.]
MKKLLLLFTIVLLVSGCSLFESSHEMEKSAEELVSEGSSAFMDEKYKNAIKAYTDLKDWYPFSKYAILAELKIADSYYHLEKYDEAVLAYEAFEKMHPKNDAVPYVIYRTGLCWFNQLDTVDRDQTPAKNSMDQFKRLIDQYPESEYVQEAEEKIQLCVENLSAHEFYVANFYYKTKKYKSALKRYESLVTNYPNSKESKEALNKIIECRALANKI